MTTLDLTPIEAAEQAATAGPWESVVDDHGRGQIDANVWSDALDYYITEKITSGPNHVADSAFIARARTDVPALVAEVKRLRARVAEMDEDAQFLNALRAAGVDNWSGYEYAIDIVREQQDGGDR